ncbi:hypothetical protein DFH07DRAFT_769272 [Mycena maculata]|uniref:Uncharacterized protein n=1 Tax=Mycena maculata TaxID=230809 RepID=A0AAD7NMU3_9AGAR|nr:hypothetical protein DFH07DRAFT_769272 [Mycena maculata]
MSSTGNSIICPPNPSPEVGLQSANQRLVINLFEVRSRLAQSKFQINSVLLNIPEPLHAVNATNKHVCKANPHIQTGIKTRYFCVCVQELDMGDGKDLRGRIWWNLRPKIRHLSALPYLQFFRIVPHAVAHGRCVDAPCHTGDTRSFVIGPMLVMLVLPLVNYEPFHTFDLQGLFINPLPT